MRILFFIFCSNCLTLAVFGASDKLEDWREAYKDKVQEVIEWRAERVDPDDLEKGSYHEIAACLALGQNLDWASQRLIKILEKPRGDMFWMFPMTSIGYLGQDLLSAEAKQALRNAWRDYMPMRGDTENHWACITPHSTSWPNIGPTSTARSGSQEKARKKTSMKRGNTSFGG